MKSTIAHNAQDAPPSNGRRNDLAGIRPRVPTERIRDLSKTIRTAVCIVASRCRSGFKRHRRIGSLHRKSVSDARGRTDRVKQCSPPGQGSRFASHEARPLLIDDFIS
jgi:hypothetical protein